MTTTIIDNPVFRTIRNRFTKKCAVCDVAVEANQGYACEHKTGWATYCEAHVPVKIETERAEITKEGHIYFPYHPDAVSLVKSLYYSSWQKEGKFWRVSIEPEHINRVIQVGRQLGLKIADELLEIASDVQEEAEEKVEINFDTAGLFPYQVTGAAFLANKYRCLLGDEMGTGKTVQTLASLPKDVGTLVVCPASLKFNWRDETNKWRPDLTPIVLNGRKSFRLPEASEVVIVNYDILPQDLNDIQKKDFVLVCDEVHLCKNYKAKRSRAVKILSNIAKKTVGLTGTPLMNRPFDLYGVLSSLHLENEVFGSWIGFLRAFNGYKNEWGGYTFGAVSPLVPELLRRVMLRRRREEVLPDLPKKSYTTITVDGVSKSLQKRLDEVYDEVELLLEMKELPPFEMFAEIRAALAESRIEAMLEIVENHEEEEIPLVVFSAHRAPIDTLAQREGWATITGSTKPEDRQGIVRKFQSGELKGVGLTIAAGGVGLTLTRAWKALFVDLDWTPALNSQAEDRICRIGQTKPCEIVRMVSDHVLDRHIHELIAEKIDLFNNAIDGNIGNVKLTISEGETDEQYAVRMAALQAEFDAKQVEAEALNEKARRDAAKKKVNMIVEREMNKATNGGKKKFKLPEFTPVLIQSIKDNLAKMLGVCDGAQERDNVGFNKPDALLSRWLYAAGLDEPETLEAAYLMLCRYPRQVRLKLK
jgi:SWI/SNF-related matrix-associated actin-dependent regulator of chromatin subfamily A-like protein 1